jgi:hypothetical protein
MAIKRWLASWAFGGKRVAACVHHFDVSEICRNEGRARYQYDGHQKLHSMWNSHETFAFAINILSQNRKAGY